MRPGKLNLSRSLVVVGTAVWFAACSDSDESGPAAPPDDPPSGGAEIASISVQDLPPEVILGAPFGGGANARLLDRNSNPVERGAAGLLSVRSGGEIRQTESLTFSKGKADLTGIEIVWAAEMVEVSVEVDSVRSPWTVVQMSLQPDFILDIIPEVVTVAEGCELEFPNWTLRDGQGREFLGTISFQSRSPDIVEVDNANDRLICRTAGQTTLLSTLLNRFDTVAYIVEPKESEVIIDGPSSVDIGSVSTFLLSGASSDLKAAVIRVALSPGLTIAGVDGVGETRCWTFGSSNSRVARVIALNLPSTRDSIECRVKVSAEGWAGSGIRTIEALVREASLAGGWGAGVTSVPSLLSVTVR